MQTTFLDVGLACVVTAVIGGGLKAFGLDFPLIASMKRQLLLGGLGTILIVMAMASSALSTNAVSDDASKEADTVLVDTWNTDAVLNGPKQPTRFTLNTPHLVTDIRSYHWNNGLGAPRGNISLRQDDGTMFGPWEVSTSDGSLDSHNVAWQCTPNVTIPAGTYTVIDSDPQTWSYNERSGSRGMTIVKGRVRRHS